MNSHLSEPSHPIVSERLEVDRKTFILPLAGVREFAAVLTRLAEFEALP